MKRENTKKLKAFSLVEILLAIGFFSIIVFSVLSFSTDSIRATENLRRRISLKLYTQEIFNALVITKKYRWKDILDNSDGTSKKFVYQDNQYTFADGTTQLDDMTVSITLNAVLRDSNGEIVLSGGTEDIHTREIIVSAEWIDIMGNFNTTEYKFYLNDWNSPKWIQTTEADFLTGTQDFTLVANNGDGEVELAGVIYADWCKPTISQSFYDLPGQGVAKTISAIPGNAFIGTGENASGLSFINTLVDESDPPVITIDGTLDGYKTNDIFGETSFAYLATDTNSSEVVILDLSTTPYDVVGWYDSKGPTNADAVFVMGNVGFAGIGNKVNIFDLTGKTGPRPQIGKDLVVSGKIRDITGLGDYIYVTTDSNTEQVQIVSIIDVANPTIVGSIVLDGGKGIDTTLNTDGTRAYVATENSSTSSEFFIVDLSEKTGPRPTLGSYDAGLTEPSGIMTIYKDGRSILVGHNGEEYQAIDISNESTPTRCGGIDVDSGINDIVSVIEDDGDAFSYILKGDASQELGIIRGGEGGGNAQGHGYAKTGTFTSSVFDSGYTTSSYILLSWFAQVPVGTTLQLQVRTGTTPDLSAIPWTGPDGTSSTYFTDPRGTYLHSTIQDNRYVQFKADMTSDTISTPILEETLINYQE